MFGIKEAVGHSLYLGLPTFSMWKKKLQFQYLVERVARRIHAWQGRFLSAGGKEVLIKAVIQSIPTYAMGCFRLPVATCKKIEKLCAKFWWRDKEQASGVHWQAWAEICRPKYAGGMGFRNLIAFNKSLLAKSVWRLISQPDSLLARVFKARYHPLEDILDCKEVSNASFIWRSIYWSRDIIARGTRWKFGDGQTVRIYKDALLLGSYTGRVVQFEGRDNKMKVGELMTVTRTWDMEKVRACLLPWEVECVSAIEIPAKGVKDSRYWALQERGVYSVKSGYRLEMGFLDSHPSCTTTGMVDWWRWFWKINVPPKVVVFGWRAYKGFVPVDLQLHKHHIPITGICGWCKKDWGSIEHTLIFCEAIRCFWKSMVFWEQLSKWRGRAFGEVMELMKVSVGREKFALWLTTTWMLWRELCRAKHESKPLT